jgi:transcription elongation factor Elf1
MLTRRQHDHRQRPKPTLNLFVMRDWMLTCDSCEHVGSVRATATQMRRWNAEAKLVCSSCGNKQTSRRL